MPVGIEPEQLLLDRQEDPVHGGVAAEGVGEFLIKVHAAYAEQRWGLAAWLEREHDRRRDIRPARVELGSESANGSVPEQHRERAGSAQLVLDRVDEAYR